MLEMTVCALQKNMKTVENVLIFFLEFVRPKIFLSLFFSSFFYVA